MHTKESILAAIQAIRIPSGVKQIINDVITELPEASDVVEVSGCGECPMYGYVRGFHSCDKQEEDFLHEQELFATCPVKTKAITIKLKEYEQ